MTKTTKITGSTVETRTAVMVSLKTKGDRYNQAFIAAIAHEIVLNLQGDKLPNGFAARLSESLDYDKGNISRIKKILVESSTARVAATKLDVITIDDSEANLLHAVAVGKLFARVPSTKATKSAGVEEETDLIAAMYDWLLESESDTFAGRVSAIEDMLANVAAARASKELEERQAAATA